MTSNGLQQAVPWLTTSGHCISYRVECNPGNAELVLLISRDFGYSHVDSPRHPVSSYVTRRMTGPPNRASRGSRSEFGPFVHRRSRSSCPPRRPRRPNSSWTSTTTSPPLLPPTCSPPVSLAVSRARWQRTRRRHAACHLDSVHRPVRRRRPGSSPHVPATERR
ncbi:hypothetical protein K466DRAFT_662880 [Polyporus arcularius HHB13444]|uniref:Uncharacterized protein n=1 Tax=Polyporus arcularius HHB13444 TaxID=1314778 RepID=A0A5C3PF23_9APHY|nr:hypothetical protein K466DRAFT_662880 [Polyporus arcularius HHB13444]